GGWRARPAIANFSSVRPLAETLALRKYCFGATPKPACGTHALPKTNQTRRFFITSFLQLRELDLLDPDCFGGQPSAATAGHRPALLLLFSSQFFRASLWWRRLCQAPGS